LIRYFGANKREKGGEVMNSEKGEKNQEERERKRYGGVKGKLRFQKS
jgi:hypothetical protein